MLPGFLFELLFICLCRPLVWRQFCLSYQGHKLLTETDYLRDYGIKDGDQVCVRFIEEPVSSL